MKFLIKTLVPALVILLSCMSYAGEKEISQGSVNKLMIVTGLNTQVADLPDAIFSGIELRVAQKGVELPAEKLQAIRSILDTYFKVTRILSYIKRDIANTLSEAEAQELFVWYGSAVGKKITEAEKKSGTPEAVQQMMNEQQTLLADKERIAVAQQLDALTASTDFLVLLQKNATLSAVAAISSGTDPETSAEQMEDMKIALDAQEPQIREALEEVVILSFLYTYKGIDLKELHEYVVFLEKPASKKLTSVITKSMYHSLNQSMNQMAARLVVGF